MLRRAVGAVAAGHGGGFVQRTQRLDQRIDLRQDGAAPFVMPGGPVIPAISLLAMLAITATLTAREWSAIGVALAVLMLLYAILTGLRHRTGP